MKSFLKGFSLDRSLVAAAGILFAGCVFPSVSEDEGPNPLSADISSQEETISPNVPTQPQESIRDSLGEDSGMLIVLLLVCLVALISVAVNFYFYRWRRILSSQPHLLMPEEYVGSMQALRERVSHLSQQIPPIQHEIQQTHTELLEAFLTLQKSLEEKDQEIQRLKRGYDLKIFRKFLRKFVTLNADLRSFLSDDTLTNQQSLEELRNTHEMLWDALEECGVESFSPKLGESYLKAEGVSDPPKKEIDAESPEGHNQISKVLQEGYRVSVADGKYIYIKKAEVEVTIHKERS